ncbi:MAG: OmpA family protein [Bacteroidota bacterium]
MKIKIILFVALVTVMVFYSSLLSAQRNYTQEADEAFKLEQYDSAIDMYKKAYSKVKKNRIEKSRILIQIAECYLKKNDSRRMEDQFGRLVKSNLQKQDPTILLKYANSLKMNEKYADALIQYKAYEVIAPNDPEGKIGEESCTLALAWKDNPTRYQVTNEKKYNSREDDFSPAYNDKRKYNSIVFTSARDGSTGHGLDAWTGQNFSDFYIIQADRKGNWSTPVLFEEDEHIINSEANEGQAWFNEKGTTIYFTRCPNEKKKQSGCQICVSQKKGKSWGDVEVLKLTTDSFTVGHPSLTEDELTMYFVSDMPGGFGGKDIWVATRSKKTKPFDHPVNLGGNVNTPGDEMFPVLRNDSTLFFSSNYLPGMGGLDMFKSVKNKKTQEWGVAENLKSPLNSSYDDFGLIYDEKNTDGERGYFTSNRKGGRGGDDLYSFYLPPLVYTLKGVVRDDSTLQLIPGALVKLKGSDGTLVEVKTDNKGFYSYDKKQILPNTSYDLAVTKTGYFGDKGKETTVGLNQNKDFVHDFRLVPIPIEPIELPEILYDLAKWDLKAESQDSLIDLIKILQTNPSLVIELRSHTDARPIPMTNDSLSQKRAQSVVDFLISRGINSGRLVAKGYGEKVPRTLKADKTVIRDKKTFTFTKGTQLTVDYINTLKSTEEKEAAHQLNRRTEFSILRNDFVPPPSNDTIAKEFKIAINPEDNVVSIVDTGGTYRVGAIVLGRTLTMAIDKTDKIQISMEEAMKFLKEARISKSDFVLGEKAIGPDGNIIEKSVLVIKEVKVGNKIVNNLGFTVMKAMKQPIMIGEKVFTEKIGAFTIDKEKKQLIFN